jgi:hypothetical protein
MKIYSPTITGSAANTNIVTTTSITSLNALSASFAATSSYANSFTVGGTLTAQTINVQIITSSIEFNTGSTRNGALSSNTHQFTGSVLMSGSLTVGSLSSPEKISTIYGVNIATTSGNGGNLTIKAGGGSGAGNTAGNLYLGFGRGNSSALNGSMYFGLAQSTDIAGLDTTYMAISSSGRVSVGTTSTPLNSQFSVVTQDAGGIMFYSLDSPGNSALYWYSYSSAIEIEARTSNNLTYRNIVLAPNGGNVGVGLGASMPGTTLQVNGAITSVNGSATLPNATWVTVYTFNVSDIMMGTFSFTTGGTHASSVCLFNKTYNGGGGALVIGGQANQGAGNIQVSGNSIQVMQSVGAGTLGGTWWLTRLGGN